MTKCPATMPLASVMLDRSSDIPLYVQLHETLRHAILKGQLPVGTRLPSTRDLATDLGISRNTVVNAFDRLLADGYIEGKIGAGTYVASVLNTIPVEAKSSSSPPTSKGGTTSKRGAVLAAMRGSISHSRERPKAFRPCLPALDAFPVEIWSRLVSRRWRRPPLELLGYSDPAGYLPLRELIANHLRIVRAIHCEVEQVIMVSGTQQAIDLASRVLFDPGDAVWVEDPGYLGARRALLGAAAHLVPVPVDGEGLDVAAGVLRCAAARLAYVTPSHQFPLGVTMSLTRRLALLNWAYRSDAWILEDDYDSEYRYTGTPLPSLQGLDTDGRVIYMGTFNKVLFPSLRLGYLIVPAGMVDAFVAARAIADRQSPAIEQAVLADFMAEGHYTRHIRRMRTLYGERQLALVETARQSGLLDIYPSETGIHLTSWLPEHLDDCLVSQQASMYGIEVPALSMYAIEPLRQGGLVLGYAAVEPGEIREGARRLESVFKNLGFSRK